jgi:hypothetical protein
MKRPLTATEVAFLNSIFGAMVDYDAIAISNGPVPGQREDTAMSIFPGVINMYKLYQNDYTLSGNYGKSLLAHEVVHQFQISQVKYHREDKRKCGRMRYLGKCAQKYMIMENLLGSRNLLN